MNGGHRESTEDSYNSTAPKAAVGLLAAITVGKKNWLQLWVGC